MDGYKYNEILIHETRMSLLLRRHGDNGLCPVLLGFEITHCKMYLGRLGLPVPQRSANKLSRKHVSRLVY